MTCATAVARDLSVKWISVICSKHIFSQLLDSVWPSLKNKDVSERGYTATCEKVKKMKI